MLTACASGGAGRNAKVSDYRVKSVDVGMATKALAALNANDFASAIQFGEKAVAQSPKDAGFRALLGNAYFGAGRFASAEQAYRDSLSLYAAQPQVMLKLALVEISLGRVADARELIDYARGSLDPADYGLALALAGRAEEAVEVLRHAAGSMNSDARVRQNLALAYALSGDWVNARVVAAQDVAPNELDDRIRQWMELAGAGSKPATRVAALTGITPNLTDPGQPVQLALAAPVQRDTAVAAAEPVEIPAPVVVSDAVTYAPPPPPPYEVPAQPAIVAASAPVEAEPQTGSITVKLPEANPAAEAIPAIAAAAPAYVPPALVARSIPLCRGQEALGQGQGTGQARFGAESVGVRKAHSPIRNAGASHRQVWSRRPARRLRFFGQRHEGVERQGAQIRGAGQLRAGQRAHLRPQGHFPSPVGARLRQRGRGSQAVRFDQAVGRCVLRPRRRRRPTGPDRLALDSSGERASRSRQAMRMATPIST